MITAPSCPQCGAALPESVLQGLCSRCLAREAGDILTARSASPFRPSPSTALHYFGDYELLEEIARGGMGVVWKARQISLNRTVAVKMLLAGKFSSPEFVQRFRAEAEAAANLQHPNIVAIHEVGDHEGHQYFSMEYVEGKNLAELARERPLPARRAAAYLKVVAEAVHYAHQRGVLHRDLKPSNILIDDQDQPHVTDFGLAKRFSNSKLETENSELTLTGQVLGTPGFISPEQAGGKRGAVSPASDVYSLGAVLYFLLTERAPVAAASLEETLRQIHEMEPVSPRLLNPALPRDLETICLKSLSKEPARRYASAQALAEDLERFLSGDTIVARPARAPERFWRWCRRKPALATLMLALLLVGTAGLAGILWQWRRAELHAANETTQRLRAQQAVSMLELQRVEDLLEKDEVVMGMAYLSRIVRQQPTNQIAARRLLSALTQRNFALPVGLPLQHGRKVNYAEFSPDSRKIVTAALDLGARIWDARTGEPLTPPMTHLNAVRFAHFSPDGQRIVTIGDDSEAVLWNAATGRRIGEPLRHNGKMRDAQFSPDGQRVVTASADGTARVWNGHTGEAAVEPLAHKASVGSARFSPDGRQIVTASLDSTAQVWDAPSGRPFGKPFQHSNGVESAEFSPDGKKVVTISKDFSTAIWDIASGKMMGEPMAHGAPIDMAKFSPEGERVIVGQHNGVTRIFNARDWTPLTQPMRHGDWVTSADFSPEAQRVLTASLDSTARLWDANTGEPLTPPMQHDQIIWSARLSPDGLFAVTASADSTARIWDVRLGAMRKSVVNANAPISIVEFRPDGERIVTGLESNSVQIWNAHTGEAQGSPIEDSTEIMVAKFSKDGRILVTASRGGLVRIWDAHTGRPSAKPFNHGNAIGLLDLSADGHWLVTASKYTNMVRLWNMRTGDPHGQPFTLRSHPTVARFSPDGQRLLLSDYRDDMLQLYDVASGKLRAETAEREGAVTYAEFSPNGQRVLSASSDETARIWDGHTLRPIAEPMRHKGGLVHARFSHDGQRVVTTTESAAVAQVWDAQTCQPVGEMMRHRDWVRQAEFSPDGTLVVTGSRDGTARLWDALTGRPVAEPFQHPDNVVSAHFSPDGRRVLTGTQSGGAYLWDVPSSIPTPDSPQQRNRFSTLLADLAEALIGKRVNEHGALESTSSASLTELRRSAAGLPPDRELTRWLEWFFNDRSTRAISPYSATTLLQYVDRCGHGTSFRSWHEGLMLRPMDGWNLLRLANGWLREAEKGRPEGDGYAEWASRHAVKSSPWSDLAWLVRVGSVERRGAWSQLLGETREALVTHNDNPYLWYAHACAFEKLSRFEEMATACNRGLEAQQKHWRAYIRSETNVQRDLLIKRSIAHQALGRPKAAIADQVAHFGLTPRDPRAAASLIDLSLYYNGVTGEDFAFGLQRCAGTDFDFRGWIQLDARLANPEITNLPERVRDVPIEGHCRRMYFLHTAGYSAAPTGTVIARYVIHYADGQELEIPVVYGRDVGNYWYVPGSTQDNSALVVAWTGSSPHSRQQGATTRLYKSTWENPRPDVSVRTLDFVHAKTRAVPILLAITLEP